jgi:hypothetical protein
LDSGSGFQFHDGHKQASPGDSSSMPRHWRGHMLGTVQWVPFFEVDKEIPVKMNSRFRVVTLSFGLMLGSLRAAPATPAETRSTVANAKLEDFAFLSGHNRGEYEGGVIDEHWSEPAGDSMIGMYCYIKNGKVQMYEFLSIEMVAEGSHSPPQTFQSGTSGLGRKGSGI